MFTSSLLNYTNLRFIKRGLKVGGSRNIYQMYIFGWPFSVEGASFATLIRVFILIR